MSRLEIPSIAIKQSADVVLVGGGVIGASCAKYLSQDGIKVVLVERSGLAMGTSSACQGGVGLGLYTEGYDLRLRLAAIEAYESLQDEGLDVSYRQEGTLYISERDELDYQKARVQVMQDRGLACQWLDQQTLLAEEPTLNPMVVYGASLLLKGGSVYPMRVVLEMIKCAKQFGAQIYSHTELVGIEKAGGKVTAALTSQGRIATERILIAAGVWSSEVGKLANLKVPVWPLKGHVMVTEPVPRILTHYISDTHYEKTVETTQNVEIDANGPKPIPPQYAVVLQNLDHGQILIGSSREFAGFNQGVSRECLVNIASMATRLVPVLAKLNIIRVYTGLRPWTPDGLPIIGPTQQSEGIIFATGHAGDGNTLAILTGKIIADLFIGQEATIEIEPLSPDRFVM